MNDFLLLLIVLATVTVASVFLLFISWIVTGLVKAGDMPMGFISWSKMTLIEIGQSTRSRTLIINVFFHFIVLGLVIRPLFFPDMPNVEHWLAIILMTAAMRPIVAYFYGWEMTFKNTVAADAPKYQRFIVFVVMVSGYILVLLLWLGIIDHLEK